MKVRENADKFASKTIKMWQAMDGKELEDLQRTATSVADGAGQRVSSNKAPTKAVGPSFLADLTNSKTLSSSSRKSRLDASPSPSTGAACRNSATSL